MRLLPDRLNASLSRGHGITLIDYEVLARLSEAPLRRLRMTELAEGALLSKSRLSHQISRMEKEGLVRREPCGTDGGGHFAGLTDAGRGEGPAAGPPHGRGGREAVVPPVGREEALGAGGGCSGVGA